MSADLCPLPGKVPDTRKVLGDEFSERRKGGKEEGGGREGRERREGGGEGGRKRYMCPELSDPMPWATIQESRVRS